LEGRTEPSDATILVRWKGSAVFGDELRLSGFISPIDPPRNPGEFDMRAYLERRDVRRVLFVSDQEGGVLLGRGGGNPILRMAQQSRNWLQSVLCRGLDDSPEVKEFISGITLGLRHQTPEDIEEPFQQTGTLHLFAVAGLHVGIVADLLWILTGLACIARRWAALIIIPLILFYSAVTGLHISSVRAAVMCAVFMGGFMIDRRVFNLNSLAAAAVLLLCWNTNELFASGFQLSFAVVGTIVLLADPVTKWFRRFTAPDPFLPKALLSRSRRLTDPVLLKLTQSTSISLTAWIGSLVLLFWYFHLITPISLIANLVVVPIAFFILAVALLSIISAALVPWIVVIFNNANWCLAELVIGIVHLFAQLPGGHHYLPHPPGLGSALAKVTVLDLGTGAGVHLQTPHQDWLFDCGSERTYNRIVREYLHSAGVNRINTLLLSHGDSQHIGGASQLISEMRPAVLIDNPAPDRSSIHKRVRGVFRDQALNVTRPVQGDTLPIGEQLSCAVLYPPRNFSTPVGDDQTLVLRIQCHGGPRILLMSDSGFATEKALLDSSVDLRSDIIIKGQHHSGQSGSDEFLKAVRPRLIVATSRDFPRHERVDDQWAEKLRTQNVKLFRQSDTGAVEIWFRENGWEARAYVTGETFRSSSR
jgi:ComEC/Rec2-related protein